METQKTPMSSQIAKKRPWLVAGALALVGTIAVVFWPGAPEMPRVAEVLPARETVGFVAVESPDVWLQALDRAATTLTAEERARLERWLSTAARQEALGFDPASAAGWQKAGVDPERGLALSFDARTLSAAASLPFVWVGAGPPQAEAARALSWQTLAKWSVASLPQAPTWTASDGPRLDHDPVLHAAFADMPTGARTSFYAHADGLLAALQPHLDARKKEGLTFLSQRIRGASLVIAPTRTAGRVILSSDAVESLRQIFGDTAPKQRFSGLLPQDGVVALRVSLNLQELFDGLMTWLPPQWLEMRLGLASGRLGLLATVGLDWTQLERALSGQAVLALDLSAPATADAALPWLGLLAVRDATVTDAALQHLAQKASQRGKPVVAVQVAGHAGWQSQDPAMVVVRVADMLVVAANVATAERALRQPHAMPETAELDGDVVMGLVVQPASTPAAGTPSWQQALARLEPMALALRRDLRGLRLEASALPLTTVLRAAAWLLRAP